MLLKNSTFDELCEERINCAAVVWLADCDRATYRAVMRGKGLAVVW
jgi:hypothetical protein